MPIETGKPEPELPEIILIHAPFGYGKTFAAASASARLPLDAKMPLHIRPHVTLDDMIWCKVDTGALDGFAEAGLHIPPSQVIDASHMSPETLIPDLREIVITARRLADSIRKKGLYPQFVLDTATAIDVLMNAKWSATIEANIDSDSQQQRKDNNFAVFRTILNTWTPFYASLNSIDMRKIILGHETVKGDSVKGESVGARLKRQASGVTEAAVAMSITGKASDLWHGNGSLVLMIDRIRKQTPTGTVFERVFKQGIMEAVTKARYNCLGSIEPCDLRAVFAKIKAARL